jgi:hypothetical protein
MNINHDAIGISGGVAHFLFASVLLALALKYKHIEASHNKSKVILDQ